VTAAMMAAAVATVVFADDVAAAVGAASVGYSGDGAAVAAGFGGVCGAAHVDA